MTSIHRFRHIDPQRVASYPVDSATVIEVGDLVYLEVDDVRPASGLTYGASLANAQGNFAKKYVGVAMTASANGETDPVQVARAGTFEFACAAGQFEVGDLVNADDNTGGTALEDQQVIAVGENGIGIGRVAKRYSANTTSVLIEIFPLSQGRQLPAQVITLFAGAIGAAADLVTNWPVPFPFKLNAVRSITTVLTDTAATVVTVEKNTTALDDTHTIPDASAVGAVVETVMDDATGDDIYQMGDTLSLVSDGGAVAGEAVLQIVVQPFLNES